MTGAWSRDGYSPPAGVSPVQGAVYGRSRAPIRTRATGTLRLGPFHLDRHSDMGIPVLTGLDDRNLSLLVRDAESKKVLARGHDPPPVQGTWWAWHPKTAARAGTDGGGDCGRYGCGGGTVDSARVAACAAATQAGSGVQTGAVPGWRVAAGNPDIDK